MRKLFWSGPNEKSKFPLIAWDKVCSPKEARGTSLRQIGLMNLALGQSWFGT